MRRGRWLRVLFFGLFAMRAALATEAPGKEAVNADLPTYASVVAALADFPTIAAARANVRAQEAVRSALTAGPHEYALRLEGIERRERNVDVRYNEWNAIIERGVRLPGKSILDGRIGEESVAQAQSASGDAVHEAGRMLLRQWFAWMRAGATAAVWANQVGVLTIERDIVERRVRLGDAPRQEMLLAASAVAQADASRLQAQSRVAAAQAELRASFPAIELPVQPVVRAPRPIEHDATSWREVILQHNHELAVARAEVRRRLLIESRARAEQVPDPTLGMRFGSERGGNDRVVGLFVSVPLPGELRRARQAEAAAGIDAATAREAALVRRLSAEASALYETANAAYASAERAAQAAEGLARHAALTSKAYGLGEVHLADVLLARRNAIEAELAATLARLEAAESRYRLLLDAHELWPLD